MTDDILYYNKYLKYKNKYFNLKYSFETAQSNIKQVENDLATSKKLVNNLYIKASNKLEIVNKSPSNITANNEHKQAVVEYNKAVNESLRLEKIVNDYKKALGYKSNANVVSNKSKNPYEDSINKYMNEIELFLNKDIPEINRYLDNLERCYKNPKLNYNTKNQIEKQHEYYISDLKEKQNTLNLVISQKNKIKNTFNLNQLKLILDNLKNIDLQSRAHKNILKDFCSI
jgi:hypothetical protein